MCLACEQDAIWFDYLEQRGLLTPGDPAAAEALFANFPIQPLPVQGEAPAAAPAKNNPFSCDDPTNG